MEENPYKSPDTAPEAEKRPVKPPIRFFYAAVCGVATLGGLFIWQATLVGLPLFVPPHTMLLFALVPGTVALAVASWAWRSSELVWPAAVAGLLWGSSLAFWFLGGLFLDLP